MNHADSTEPIIGCSYRIYNVLGSGFLESVYERALEIELGKLNIPVKFQQSLNVLYDGQSVGVFIADLVVDNKIIVELKAVKCLAVAHEVQLVNYLAATNISIGLLINFGESKVEIKRKYLNLNQKLSC
jgi:GxxExxY protein